MNLLNRSLNLAGTVALAGLLGGNFTAACAQQTAPATTTPTFNLSLPSVNTASDLSFSSSDSQNGEVIAENHFDFVNAAAENAQPGQRRYGRPRYRGGNTNSDGSNKYDFFGGVGFTQPLGNTYHSLSPSFSFQFGGGRQFNKNVALNAQFDWDNFVFNNATLTQQLYIYNSPQIFGAGAVSQLGGSSHVWSFTLDPTYTLLSREGLGAYVVVGVGFYHKTANFTTPVQAEGQDPFSGFLYSYEANQTIDKYTSNAVGFNGGFGLTYKFSRFSNERFYGEVRYVFVDNQPKPGYTALTIASAPTNATNLFPANSHRTTYIPVKFGIRF